MARITGPIVMIGFGSIGRGTLPLIERHFDYDQARFVGHRSRSTPTARCSTSAASASSRRRVTQRELSRAPDAAAHRGRRPGLLRQPVGRHLLASTSWSSAASSARSTSTPSPSPGPASTSTSLDGRRTRTNYALRETMLDAHAPQSRRHHRGVLLRRQSRHGVVVRQAGAAQRRRAISAVDAPRAERPRGAGRALMRERRRQGHPHRRARHPARQAARSRMDVFVNTWSVEGFVSEGMQPAELGWGTHENWMPDNGRDATRPARSAAIYLLQPGADTRVRSWCPTPRPQYGFLVTHNESISIADYFTVRDGEQGASTARPATTPTTRPTTRCCRCTRCSARPASVQDDAAHPRRERDRRRHRRARRAALRPRQERLLVRLAALRSRRRAASRPTRTPPACR